VLKTAVGSAQSVAVAIDTARWPEVVGTISGDDTIFIATVGASEQHKLRQRLRAVFGR
jgi:transcriptional regulator of arginine metabolism